MNPVRVALARAKLHEALCELAEIVDFEGPPDDELLGWAKLARLGREREARPHVYFMVAESIDLVKLGWTSSPTTERINTLQTGSPVRLSVSLTFPGTKFLEASMHRRFAEHCRHGEWFAIDGEISWLTGLAAARLAEIPFPEEAS